MSRILLSVVVVFLVLLGLLLLAERPQDTIKVVSVKVEETAPRTSAVKEAPKPKKVMPKKQAVEKQTAKPAPEEIIRAPKKISPVEGKIMTAKAFENKPAPSNVIRSTDDAIQNAATYQQEKVQQIQPTDDLRARYAEPESGTRIQFAFNSFDLPVGADLIVQQLASQLQADQKLEIQLTAHSLLGRNKDKNRQFSNLRMGTIQNRLIALGVEPGRIKTANVDMSNSEMKRTVVAEIR